MATNLIEALAGNTYEGYAYTYPHKTAYRPLRPPVPLRPLWEAEDRSALFLYVHVPFCEMRCGFCNLLTLANPKEDMVSTYLEALQRQASVVKEALGAASFARLAVGGGTPSFLDEAELEKLFSILEDTMPAQPQAVPFSFEVSPKTVSQSKLQYLRKKGVDRISMGVQSFVEEESKALGRSQRNKEVAEAIRMIQEQGFPTFNVDLIYGGAGQTPSSWLYTLDSTLQYEPEEVYLYPLYVRPLTGLEKLGVTWDNFRLALYRQGREYLLDHGYEQISMRMFRRKNTASQNDTVYCCQEDGMVGLGAGARSYTRTLHYATEYAVGRKGVKNIIQDFIGQPDSAFAQAYYGIRLNEEEQQRRYIIKSLLHAGGLDLHRYQQRFHEQAFATFSPLEELVVHNLAYLSADGLLRLTPAGMERSDTIGPWLYSSTICSLMNQYELQ